MGIKCKVPNESLIGQKFGKLTILRIAAKKGVNITFDAQCECGIIKNYYKSIFISGTTKSCGNCGYRESLMENLVGKECGKLIVQYQMNSDKSGQRSWMCKCECGSEKILTTEEINSQKTKSCGCIRAPSLANTKMNNLNIKIKIDKRNYLCNCDCGNTKLFDQKPLMRGNIKTCGCAMLRIKDIKENVNHLNFIKKIEEHLLFECDCGKENIFSQKELTNNMGKHCECMDTEYQKIYDSYNVSRNNTYDDKTIMARKLWIKIINLDKEKMQEGKIKEAKYDLLFDDYYKISQMNCTYCGLEPHLKRGEFIRNTIDRIDNSKNHSLKNCVAACDYCNKAKNDRSVEDFLTWVAKLKINNYPEFIHIENLTLPKYKADIRLTYFNYNDSDLSLEQFYYLTQQPCFYCNEIKVGKRSKRYNYNGLDRLDSSKDHHSSNIVTCCKWCNYAKSNKSLEEFNSWIKRIQNFQKQKSTILMVL